MDRMPTRGPNHDGNQARRHKHSLLGEPKWDNMSLPPSFSREGTWTAPDSSHSGQISPRGGFPMASTNNGQLPCSVTSSCDGSWASSVTDHDEIETETIWDEWEQGSDSAPVVPKDEPMDDEDISMAEIKSTSVTPSEAIPSASTQKRGRGRPRKNPVPTPANGTKVTKGRSKTGCITCRKRKKKCDEAKPGCMY